MRLITTKITRDMNTGKVSLYRGYLYNGEAVLLKKGREEQQQVASGQLEQMKADTAQRANQLAKAEPFISGLESTAPGQLSPLSESQYGADTRNIAKTYGDIRANGLRAIGQRGFANAPSGMLASVINTAGQNQGADETHAYENALQQTYGQGLEAAKMRLGLVSTYDPTKPAAVASDAAARRAQMGSTLGDIGGGISQMASAAAGLGTGFNLAR
jgi:hypothetical protein